jgi:hypothetical protein
MRRVRPDGSAPAIPEIVQAVLIQASRLRAAGVITTRLFNSQLKRLVSEELLPRGLSVVVQKTPAGQSRLVLKERNGTVRHTFDC